MQTTKNLPSSAVKRLITSKIKVFVYIIYSGANKYLIHCRFLKFSHLQRMERSVIFIVGTPQL